ncbi:hypothetical protein K5D44_04990 [Pseudomonas cichorii]|nr:hypothetical protein [Pseudomonas cichorii]MBX8539070.1 hypothetical protein [Pseudomonas cichorii]MBX8553225.1 hypothetical protein [Pseudomonas cichorii]MBX8559357.1 hypothetical protein [Pseudomonas cichorii]MBX8564035.1 hypothetical protein [Pseudomonas cichorii]MBX8568702.1 hypothetical protein [Pseudomonas cichorii]
MKRFGVLAAFLFFSSSAQATEGECKRSIPRDAILFQQFNLGADFACLYESPNSNERATLSFYTRLGDRGIVLSSNNNLLSLGSVKDGTNLPEIIKIERGTYQVLWLYPNGVDAIELTPIKGGLIFKGATKEIRFPSLGNAEEAKSITLINNMKNPEKLAFSDINSSEIFNKRSLKLMGGGVTAKISSAKAFLYSEPSDPSKTKSYLIAGDEVDILEYKDGFFKISYKMKSGRYLNRWVSMSSVI